MIDGRLFYYNHQDIESHILISRVQMEQESAKIVKKDGKLLLDWNAAGNPLLEIVSESQFIKPIDCKLVVQEMQEMLSTLGVSEAKLETGSMRVDINISVHSATSPV